MMTSKPKGVRNKTKKERTERLTPRHCHVLIAPWPFGRLDFHYSINRTRLGSGPASPEGTRLPEQRFEMWISWRRRVRNVNFNDAHYYILRIIILILQLAASKILTVSRS